MKAFKAAVLLLLIVLAVPPVIPPASGQDKPPQPEPKLTPPPEAQEVPVAKPEADYMSTFLSRSTRPLGLKEDVLARKLLQQRPTKWASRAGLRHIFS